MGILGKMISYEELNKYHKYLHSFLKDKKVLIAISGGIDSCVLTHVFHKLKYDISLAHCNFMLRGKESNKDEIFVKELGERLQVPTYTIRFDTETFASKYGISTQMAARDLRYNWFNQLTEENDIAYILTAHQKDDVIETFLINLTRGTGLDGLLGIPVLNNNIVRPLLNFSREDIENYAKEQKLEWREDISNNSTKYLRNKLRLNIMPQLDKIAHQWRANVLKLSDDIVTSEKILETHFNDDTVFYDLGSGIGKIVFEYLAWSGILSEFNVDKNFNFDIANNRKRKECFIKNTMNKRSCTIGR